MSAYSEMAGALKFVNAIVLAPDSFAIFKAFTVSIVLPEWDTPMARSLLVR